MTSFDVPEYVGKSLLELLFLIFGGLLVGWITHTYFARKAAIVEIEGEVMKKRLSIYEELYRRINLLITLEALPAGRLDAAFDTLKKSGFEITVPDSTQTLAVMHTARGFTKAYMELDAYINNHRLYYETAVDKALLLFSNYMAIYRRLQVIFEEQIIAEGLSLDDSCVSYYEDLLMTEICILYQDEFSSEVNHVLEAVKAAISSPARHKRKAGDHTMSTFGDNGAVLRYLKQLRIFQQRNQIHNLIADNMASAFAASTLNSRK